MAKVSRVDYVNRSKLFFECSFVLTMVALIFGSLYILVFLSFIDVIGVLLKLSFVVSFMSVVTWVLYCLYKSDRKLLESKENKYIYTRKTGVGNIPYGGEDFGGE